MNVSKIAPNLHYCGKILKQGNKYFTGTFFKNLNSGKNLCLNYKNGFLKKAVLSSGEISTKVYDYDSNNRLINVSKDGNDIFVKVIKNKLGLDFRRSEIINDDICKVYNREDELIYNRILSKSLSSNFFHRYSKELNADIVKEDRYFISNLVRGGNGNYYIKVDKGCPVEPVFEWFKTIYKLPKSKHNFIIDKTDNKLSGNLKDKEGNIIAHSSTLLDKNNQPLWEQINGSNGLSLDFKSFYSEEGVMEREMSVFNSKYYKAAIDKTFDERGNIIKERCIDRSEDGNIRNIFVFERKFNENNLMIEEKKYKEIETGKVLLSRVNKEYNSMNLPVKIESYNSKEELISVEYNAYDKRGQLRVSAYKSYDNDVESGYDVFDKYGNLRKRALLYEDELLEELYDKNGFNTKLIYKNENGSIKYKYKYSYSPETGKVIFTEKSDGNNNILYTVKHSYSDGKEIREYSDANGCLKGKQFIYTLGDDYNYIYTDAKGKRCKYEYLANILDDFEI